MEDFDEGVDRSGATLTSVGHAGEYRSRNARSTLSAREGRWYLPIMSMRAVVAESGAGPLANEVVVGSHRLLADEPEALGGGDTGPGPYGLLCAALGACTSMTVRMYAGRKDWPLERVEVTVDHERVDGVDVFTKSIELTGDLDRDQVERLREIAGRCPVHRTLEASSRVVTR
jgi:putative redox protein